MNLLMFLLFCPQSKHWTGKAHLLVTDMELFARKLMIIASPQDQMFMLLEATMVSDDSCFTGQEIAVRVSFTAPRKSDLLSLGE